MMSKKIFLAIFSLVLQLGFLPHPTIAAMGLINCQDAKIDWSPKNFTDGQAQYLITVTIQNTNTFNNLKRQGNWARLIVDQNILRRGGTFTPPVEIKDSQISFDLTGPLAASDRHTAELQISTTQTGTYDSFCSDIFYQIGTLGECFIDPSLENRMPAGSKTTINFVGKPNTDYFLRETLTMLNGGAPIKTGNDGQGAFNDIPIPGTNGSTSTLVIGDLNSLRPKACYKEIKIDPTAAPPASHPVGPVSPVGLGPKAAPIKICPKTEEEFKNNPDRFLDPAKCSRGGGKLVKDCSGSINNPAIATAIGCIHTNPAELAKDLLRFIIGIGGGLAFLMMLLGAYQMLTSQGNPETLNAGRERLTSAAIGLLFIIFAVLLLQIIGFDILQIPGFGR